MMFANVKRFHGVANCTVKILLSAQQAIQHSVGGLCHLNPLFCCSSIRKYAALTTKNAERKEGGREEMANILLRESNCLQYNGTKIFVDKPTWMYQRRLFSSSSGDDGEQYCPFTVLGVPTHSDWEVCQRAFVKLALTYHPDKPETGNTKVFVRIRRALERIRDGDYKTGKIKSETVDWRETPYHMWSDEEKIKYQHYIEWAEVGHVGFEMDEQTRREVMDAYNNLERGGHDKGGYWEMARAMVERDEHRKNIRGGMDPPKKPERLEGQMSERLLRRRR